MSESRAMVNTCFNLLIKIERLNAVLLAIRETGRLDGIEGTVNPLFFTALDMSEELAKML